jgi:hypothetical protein
MGLRERGWKGMDWMHLAQVREHSNESGVHRRLGIS